MKRVFLFCLLLFSTTHLLAQVPAQQKVCVEMQRIYNLRQTIFSTWRGAVAKSMEMQEWESKYTFPGTTEAFIKQRSRDEKPPVYYYEATIAEEKSAAEITKLFKDWEALLRGCTVGAFSLQPYDHAAPDESGISTVTYAMLSNDPSGKDTPVYAAIFRVHLNYEQVEDGVFNAILQIGCP